VTTQEIREAHGLTQRQFATCLQVTTGTVRRWEESAVRPNRWHRGQIAGLFGVAPDAIGGAQPSRSALLSAGPAPVGEDGAPMPRTPYPKIAGFAAAVLRHLAQGERLFYDGQQSGSAWLASRPRRRVRRDAFFWLRKRGLIELVEVQGSIEGYAISEPGRFVAQQRPSQDDAATNRASALGVEPQALVGEGP
jgi:transcriptional regulator with XRE-family HTH domain